MTKSNSVFFESGLYYGIKLILFVLFTIIIISLLHPQIVDRIEAIKDIQQSKMEIKDLHATISDLKIELSELENTKEDLEIKVTEYDGKIFDHKQELLLSLDRAMELRDTYNYVIEYSNSHASADFSINELLYLDKICGEYNIPIPIMLAIYEKESNFNSNAKNSISTATGYGQLIDSTAKSMYERFLNLGTYNISNHRNICVDKRLNILLSCRLMKYNIDTYKSYRVAVERYYGHGDGCQEYANDINRRLSKYGFNL